VRKQRCILVSIAGLPVPSTRLITCGGTRRSILRTAHIAGYAPCRCRLLLQAPDPLICASGASWVMTEYGGRIVQYARCGGGCLAGPGFPR
jgi:hypothetical protein